MLLCVMRTTIDIPSELLKELKKRAADERTSIRDLVIKSVTATLAGRGVPRKKFRLRDGRIKGDGLCADLTHADWQTIQALSYARDDEPVQ